MSLFRLLAACAIGLGLAPSSDASGIDCDRTAAPAERAVCLNGPVLQLDVDLGAIYGALLRDEPERAAVLRAAQRRWLQERDACGDDLACLEQRYLERIGALRHRPDALDRRAVAQLAQAIRQEAQASPEFALQRTLDRFAIRQRVTDFANVRDETDPSGPAVFPKRRPAGVTRDEWRALRRTRIDGQGEHGNVSYRLLDVDADGRRDLIVDTYAGGTGLFNLVHVLPRRGSHYANAVGVRPDDGYATELYAINGRGSGQFARWLRLQGRVYAAWVDGQYGNEHVHLLHPLRGAVPGLGLVVTYEYELSVQGVQPDSGAPPAVPMDHRLQAELTRALTQFSDGVLHDVWTGPEPLCPLPPGVEDAGFGPGHYAFEIVGELAVWLDGVCHLGRLIDWFGSYGAEGLHAVLMLKRPEEDESTSYAVRGRRRVVNVAVEADAATQE